MSWSGGVYTKGNAGSGGWAGDAASGIGIEAGRHDTQDNDFATGINQCLNKDGSNAATGNLNLNSNKITNLANASASGDAMAYGQIRNGTPLYLDTTNNRLGIGTTTPGANLAIDNNTTVQGSYGALITQFSNDIQGADLNLRKSRSGTLGTNTIVQNGDLVGALRFWGANGTGYDQCAVISCVIDGVPGATNDMPTALQFYTRADGAASLTERMRIDNAGNIGIATAAADRLHVLSSIEDNTLRLETSVNRPTLRFVRSGTSRATMFTDGGGFVTGSADSLTCRAGASGGVYLAQTGTSWLAASDKRFKKNVENLNYGLTEVLALRPIRFDYIDDETDSSSRLGFIAQEVKSLMPEVVVGDETIKLGLATTDLIPTLVKAIQQLNAKVEALEARIAALES